MDLHTTPNGDTVGEGSFELFIWYFLDGQERGVRLGHLAFVVWPDRPCAVSQE